ncbi:MAG: NADH-quinone oxidoreductase subunit H, partial [Victivallaceae bacterium]
ARFFTTAAALDTGSAFEGMGSAREVTFACLSEPALFFALLVLAKLSGSLTLNNMLHGAAMGFSVAVAAPLILVAIGLFIILLAETCRIPVDDPNTHLELTMIHEVMVLDHSGPLFGVILYSAALKMFILGAVLLHVIVPFQTGNLWQDGVLFVLEMFGLSVVIGIVESVMARLQMRHVPYLLVGALLLCGFSFILLVR